MNNNIFHLEYNVPDVYVNGSRDFQLFCKLYNLCINASKYDVDSLINIVDTELCRETVLQNLSSRIGYISDYELDSDDLRYLLRAFPIIIKNKGTKLGIIQAVNTFLKLSGVIANIDVSITNNKSGSENDSYIIRILITSDPFSLDERILREILRFVIPTGYIVEIEFVAKPEFQLTNILSTIEASCSLYPVENSLNDSIYYNNDKWEADNVPSYMRSSIGLTQVYYGPYISNNGENTQQ